MYLRPAFAASASSAVSRSGVPRPAMSDWRASAASSRTSLQSSATASPSVVSARGLISTSSASREDVVKSDQRFRDCGHRGAEIEVGEQGRGPPRVETLGDADRQAAHGRGIALGGFLDVHAAEGREEHRGAARRRVTENGRVEFAGNRHLRLDEQPLDPVAADLKRQDGLGMSARLVRGRGEADAAGLAALAGRHLGLDDAWADLGGRGGGLLGRRRDARGRHGDACLGEQGLGGMLLEVHAFPRTMVGGPPTLRRGKVIGRALPSRRRKVPPRRACPPGSW